MVRGGGFGGGGSGGSNRGLWDQMGRKNECRINNGVTRNQTGAQGGTRSLGWGNYVREKVCKKGSNARARVFSSGGRCNLIGRKRKYAKGGTQKKHRPDTWKKGKRFRWVLANHLYLWSGRTKRNLSSNARVGKLGGGLKQGGPPGKRGRGAPGNNAPGGRSRGGARETASRGHKGNASLDPSRKFTRGDARKDWEENLTGTGDLQGNVGVNQKPTLLRDLRKPTEKKRGGGKGGLTTIFAT